jgi:hypothetical protein
MSAAVQSQSTEIAMKLLSVNVSLPKEVLHEGKPLSRPWACPALDPNGAAWPSACSRTGSERKKARHNQCCAAEIPHRG